MGRLKQFRNCYKIIFCNLTKITHWNLSDNFNNIKLQKRLFEFDSSKYFCFNKHQIC